MRKHIPNLLSVLRLVLSVVLMLFELPFVVFGILYLICGISDVLDGYFARRLNMQTDFGSCLDTTADFVFICACLIKLNRMGRLNLVLWVLIAAIAAIKLVSEGIRIKKINKFETEHGISDKVLGVCIYFSMLLANFEWFWVVEIILCIMAGYVAITQLGSHTKG